MIHRSQMKIFRVMLTFCLLCGVSCSLFRKKPEAYPAGIIFPVDEKASVLLEGSVLPGIRRIENTVYLSTETGKVYSIQSKDLHVQWVYQAPESLISQPYYGHERIYLAGQSSTVYCLDKLGHIRWKLALEGQISSNILETQDGVFAGTTTGRIYVIDPGEGHLIRTIVLNTGISSNLVSYKKDLIFGCEDGHLHMINSRGKQRYLFNAGTRIGPNLKLNKTNLYFFTDEGTAYCLNLEKRKKKWSRNLEGKIEVSPAVHDSLLIVLGWNGILYCIQKGNGTIKWWRKVSSRSAYEITVVDDRVVVASFSPILLCFDLKSGEQAGYYAAPFEIRTNPLWSAPYLLIGGYDKSKQEGRLVSLKKAVNATLTPSKDSPQMPNEEVIFTATAAGFYKPEYEFILETKSEKEIVQEKSEKYVWAWYPEKIGSFTIRVIVTDEKEKAEASAAYSILKKVYSDKEKADFYKAWPEARYLLLKIPYYLIFPI